MDVVTLDLSGDSKGGPVLGLLIGLPLSISLWALAGVAVSWVVRF